MFYHTSVTMLQATHDNPNTTDCYYASTAVATATVVAAAATASQYASLSYSNIISN